MHGLVYIVLKGKSVSAVSMILTNKVIEQIIYPLH